MGRDTLRLFPDTKVYITCPGNSHTGGPELLHQLCSLLLQYGVNAMMLYTSGNFYNPVNPVLKKYHLPYVFSAEDTPHNVIVLYETIGSNYFDCTRLQKIFWWLSVDNYLERISDAILERKKFALDKPVPRFFYFQENEKDTEHWVQSEYARQFILINGVPEKNIYLVEDYLNQAFLSKALTVDLNKKENIVAFNPKKGLEITKKLIELDSNLGWRPIKNMTPEQVQQLLAKSKVYIDFGNHPGKDRIPREAAISGCVVITGKRGSAENDIDINIPAEFKFDETEEDFPKIIEKIYDTFQNFEVAFYKQKNYRKTILDDKERFEREVIDACNLKSINKVNSVAIWQGYSTKTYYLLKILLQNDFSLVPKFIVDDKISDDQPITGDFLEHHNNHNYFVINDTKNKQSYKIPFISAEDAKFLYLEGRIKKFALLMPDDTEIESLRQKINPAYEDILV